MSATIKINAAARLKVTAIEMRVRGQKLARELAKFFRNVKVSKLDGSIQVPEQGAGTVTRVLTRLGFSCKAGDPSSFHRQDMDVQLTIPHSGWDTVIHINP